MADRPSALLKSDEIELTVRGRKSGRLIPRLVWFTLSEDGKSLYLVPVKGKQTQWYQNVKKDPMVTIKVGKDSFSAKAVEVRSGLFKNVLETFVRKYGKGDVDRYYPRKDIDKVAFVIQLPPSG